MSHFVKSIDSFKESFRFILPGYNLRPLEISAAVGLEQLKKHDKFLLNRLEGISRNKIQQSAEQGFIQVNGKKVKSNYKVKPYDKVCVMFSTHSGEI